MRNSIYHKLSASLSSSKQLKAFITRFTLFAAILTVVAINGNAVSPGAPDFTFGTRGVVNLYSGNLQATFIQPDGKILIAGDDGRPDNRPPNLNFRVVRYNTDGTLDDSFGINGVVVTDFLAPQNESVFDIAIQADGKIVVAGSTPNFGASEISGFKLVRYMPNGALDTSFGTAGKVYENFNDVGGFVKSMLIQPDGKIVVAGTDRNSMLFLVRFNADGNVDSSFGTNGRIVTNSYNINETKIARQTDGKIVVAATKVVYDQTPDTTAKLIRYNTNGTLDSSFGNGGVVVASIFANDFLPAIAIQSDGKIILSGKYINESNSYYFPPLRRFNSDGSVDTSFAAETGPMINGFCTICTQRVQKILTLPDNRFYLVGYNSPIDSSKYFLSVSRYLSNGNLDLSFGFRGASYFRTSNDYYPYDTVTDATLQADGNIILAGSLTVVTSSSNYVLRIKTKVTPGSVRGDFDGDGKTDFSVFRPSDRSWYTLNSSNNSSVTARYGLGTDTITPGDYNYDRQTNFSVFRPNFGWYVAVGQADEMDFSVNNFGQSGDISTPEDYDGDGETDLAVFRPSNGTWYIRYSSQVLQNAPLSSVKFGQDGDKPVAGDYDGDGRADIAVFRPSNGFWYILRSSDNGFFATQFGIGTDRTVPADYDGDLKTDIAVYRDGTWYILRSSDNGFFATQFGEAADKPVPGDYDGDGKTDVAVFRPATGIWYVQKSSDAGFISQPYGISEDAPIPNAFVR